MTNAELRDVMVHRLRENLPSIRKIAGWSGGDLGDMLGLSRQSVSKLETGTSTVTVVQYIAIRHLLDAWIARHPENETLSRLVPLLLDDLRIWGEPYLKLRLVAQTIAATAADGVSRDAVGAFATVLLDEWEGPAREYCYVKLGDPAIAEKLGVTAETEPLDWTEVALAARRRKNG